MEYSGKVFLTIKEAAQLTGLSIRTLRDGCRRDTMPHIMSGNKFLINAPMLLDDLNRESEAGRRRRKPVEV